MSGNIPKINVVFRAEVDGLIGTMTADIIRTNQEDDGSYTVYINHWPASDGTMTGISETPQELIDLQNIEHRLRKTAFTHAQFYTAESQQVVKLCLESLKIIEEIRNYWIDSQGKLK